ncbi:MAG: metallophosphoesterase family protein [Chlamydiae bacterium]|nr:metallophosphoesterase family protein [Chlamydiota bacterium]MBI3278157.1 metallophosphoesterase family protein [Chlamydiota bacterium]
MLYAILSDIHSNLEALEAVLKDARDEGVSHFLCLGDIVGYAADPSICLKKVRDLAEVVVAGNHDYAVSGRLGLDWFNLRARRAIEWTKDQLDQEEKNYLGALPLVRSSGSFCLAHATLSDPENWKYLLNEEDAFREFKLLREKILFIGHSHVPVVFWSEEGEIQGIKSPPDFKLEEEIQYIVNVGSVGQPRDLDSRASYCLFDSQTFSVYFRRVEYDFRVTQKKILKAGLPSFLAKRLEIGR